MSNKLPTAQMVNSGPALTLWLVKWPSTMRKQGKVYYVYTYPNSDLISIETAAKRATGIEPGCAEDCSADARRDREGEMMIVASEMHDYSNLSDEGLRRAELLLKLQFNSTYSKHPAVELAKMPDYYARLQAIRDEKKRRTL